MNTERKLIQQLRDALIYERSYTRSVFARNHDALIAAADAYLASPDWIRVEDALPVVPEDNDWVNIWIAYDFENDPQRSRYGHWEEGFDVDDADEITHWRYAEQTPQPPEGSK